MSRPLRVLHVMEAMHRGGAEQVVVDHVRNAGADVDSSVCAINRGGPALEEARAAGAVTFVLDEGRRHRMLARLTRVFRLADWIRRHRIHIVNAHNPTGALYGVPAARLARVPVVRTEHNIHTLDRHSNFYLRMEPYLTRWVRYVICCAEAVRETHVPRLSRWADRFVTIPNGSSPLHTTKPRARTRAELGLDDDAVAVLSIGSLTARKSHDLLMEAFARVLERQPKARLLIAGEGEYRPEVERARARLGLETRATLLGLRDDVPDLLIACDVMAQASRREGLSIAALEAMSAGLPIVATAVGGTREAVADGETGRLVPVGDVDALAAGMLEVCGDATLRAAWGAAARRRWEREFSAARMVERTESLYRRVLEARAAD